MPLNFMTTNSYNGTCYVYFTTIEKKVGGEDIYLYKLIKMPLNYELIRVIKKINQDEMFSPHLLS